MGAGAGKRYAAEYRERLVKLARRGRSPADLAREFEPSAETIRRWVAQADREEERRSDGYTRAGRKEIQRLRREHRRLKMEVEILKKADDWFSRERERSES